MLVGRDAEREELAGRLDSALAHDGAALVLRGEAGIGKSSLLALARSEAAHRGMRVLGTTGFQAEAHVPYAGLDRLLRAAGVGGGDHPQARATVRAATGGAVGQPHRVALAVLDLVTSDGPPLLLTVDDAQWLDRASWDVFAFLARRLASEPVALLMALRDGPEAGRRLAGAGLPELAVAALPPDAARALVDRVAPELPAAARARVLDQSAGNPLGLVELASAATRFGDAALLPAWIPLSTRIERTFTALAAELPDVTRSLLLVAALDDGDGADEALAATTILEARPVTLDDAQPAVDAGLIEIDDGFRLRFRHPLLRSALRQAAGAGRRRRVHAALAEVLAAELGRQVWHLAAAAVGPDEEIARALTTIADQAVRRGGAEEAVTAFEQAARLSADPGDRSARLLSAAEQATLLGAPETVVRLVGEVDPVRLRPGPRARLSWLREGYLGEGWFGPAKLAAFARIADDMRRDGEVDAALDALFSICVRFYWTNPDRPTRDLYLAVVDRMPVDPLDGRLLSLLSTIDPIGRGSAVLDRLRVQYTRLDAPPPELYRLGNAASGIGAFELAMTFLAAADPGLRDQGRLGTVAQAQMGRAWCAAHLGDTRAALTAATQARALALDTGQPMWAVTADLSRGQAEALRGNGAVARELADAGERVLLPVGAHPMLAMVQLVRGVDALAGGRHADAYTHLHRVFDPAETAFHPYVRFLALGQLAEAGARGPRRDEVRAIADDLAPDVARAGTPAGLAALAYARAVLADDDAAEPLFLAGLDPAAAPPPHDRARLQLAYGTWLRRQRRAADCRGPLRAAIGGFDALGVRPWADRARAELRASGESLRRPADAHAALTPQELQIAQLAADGLTNREIAERLYLSPRTVTTHLYRIYPKVGVTSRTELARAMAADT